MQASYTITTKIHEIFPHTKVCKPVTLSPLKYMKYFHTQKNASILHYHHWNKRNISTHKRMKACYAITTKIYEIFLHIKMQAYYTITTKIHKIFPSI